MDIAALLKSLEATSVATAIRNSLYLFPMLEATHVIGLTIVFGTIAIVDFRLLGLASADRPFRAVASDTLKWTWVAFGVTVATGALMFSTNAGVYYTNTVFRAKMIMLLLAGINMAVFELTTGRSVDKWNGARSAPPAGKTAAIVSLVFWITIIFLGRWIGFTTTRAKIEDAIPAEINLDDLLQGIQPESPSPTTPPEVK